MNTRLTYRTSFWARSTALMLIMLLLLAFPTTALAAPAVDGDGEVTISPTNVPFGAGTGTFTFTFTANNDFAAGAQVSISIPAGWTAPRTAAGAGHISWFPGASCTLSGSPPVAVAGMDILIDIASCTAGHSFTVTYSNVTPGPVSLTPYTFIAQTDIGVGGQGLVPTTAPAPTVSVDPKTLTVTGITANAKIYDGATTATLNFASAALVGVVSPDVVNLVTSGYTADFNTKHVGTAKPVTVSGLTLGGANAGNYILTQPTSSGNITKRLIRIDPVTDTKTYDGTTSSSGLPVVSGSTPLAAGDTEPTWTQTFNNKNIGAGNKVLTSAGLVNDGNGGSNYTYNYDTISTGTISKRPITVAAETDTKTYNGNTSSAGVPIITSGSIAPGDTAPTWTQTFDNRNVGINKVLTPAGLVSDGNSGNNYAYTYAADTTGVINQKTLTVSAIGITPANKVYDGTTSASLTPGSPSLVGVVSPDVVTLVTTGATGAFVDRNAGTAKMVSISGLTLGGAGAGNYTLTQPTRSANITKKPITINAATDTKTYDGTAASSGSPTLSGSTPLVVGDSEPGWTQTFNNRNASASKVLTPAGLVNDGNSGLNYAYTYATATGVINKLSITVTAVSDSKAYDGLVTSSGLPFLSGATPLVAGDTAPTWSQTFANKNVGTGKTINPAGLVIDGNGGNNYAYNFIPDVSGVITVRAITVTALTHTKPYDGTTSSIAPNINPALVGADTSGFVQTFDTATVGTGKTLTPSGAVNDGNSGLNYAITFAPAITTGAITARPVTIAADAKSKVIGTPDPALTYHITSGSLAAGDTLTLTRAVGETAGVYAITISSFPAQSNYALTFVGAKLTITPIVTLYSTGAYDGWVLESTRTSNLGGTLNAIGTTFQLGDDALNRQYRGILSFNTIGLPDNAVIKSVVIKIKQSGVPVGTNPFSVLGALFVDVRKGAFGANALAVTDFQAAPSATGVGMFGKTPVVGWYSVTLALTGRNNINALGVTQFRLYFTKGDNNNLKADFMKFFSGNNAVSSQPQLIITYTLP